MAAENDPSNPAPIELSVDDMRFTENLTHNLRYYAGNGGSQDEINQLVTSNVLGQVQNPLATEAGRFVALGFGMGAVTHPQDYEALKSTLEQHIVGDEATQLSHFLSSGLGPNVYGSYPGEVRSQVVQDLLPGLVGATGESVDPQAQRRTELFAFGALAGIGALTNNQLLLEQAIGQHGLDQFVAKP
jgi:hypothetical protein